MFAQLRVGLWHPEFPARDDEKKEKKSRVFRIISHHLYILSYVQVGCYLPLHLRKVMLDMLFVTQGHITFSLFGFEVEREVS